VQSVAPEIRADPTGIIQSPLRGVRLPDSAVLVDFATEMGRIYFIQYSDDESASWKTAQPAIVGTGTTFQWIDNGPPKTESHPVNHLNRAYRIIKAN
jgi:hypothetical protein